ncbi:MAG: hypothetical protein K0S32_2580 [Bacteroidetes bacterium]|jgi:hypothetical protein|nr:hypothetical protein [Bacteroidota bacterium]
MKNLFILISFLFLGTASAQTDKKKENETQLQPQVVGLKPDSVNKSNKRSADFIEGTIPTPESQGFTKSIINGKEIYTKESNGMIIHYQPR